MPYTSAILCNSKMGDEAMAKYNVMNSTIWRVLASKQSLILPVLCKEMHNFIIVQLNQTAIVPVNDN